jgi:hypothetical protein
MPYGGLSGVIAVVLIIAGSCLVGQFWFYGLDFLPLLLAPPATALISKLITVPTVLGVAYHYVLWSLPGKGPPGKIKGPPVVRWKVNLSEYELFTDRDTVVVLVVLMLLQMGFSLIAPAQYWCLLIGTSTFIALVNFIPVLGQFVLVHALRRIGMTRQAFAAMLIMDAIVVAHANGTLAASHFREGLNRYAKDATQSEWSIESTSKITLFIDYRTENIVMRPKAAEPDGSFEHHRSFSSIACRDATRSSPRKARSATVSGSAEGFRHAFQQEGLRRCGAFLVPKLHPT